ncbi:MAG: NYN domain-containing protein [Syntrophobacteraceae bacterium]
MEESLKDSMIFSKLPVSFYEMVIRDIPGPAWVYILDLYPNEKKRVLEGYSSRKSSQLFHRSPVMDRLRGELQTHRALLERALGRWGEEKLTELTYLGMFCPDFIVKNLWKLRDLLGPARLFAGLFLLGLLDGRVAQAAQSDAFWSGPPDAALFDLLVPTLSVWGEFIEKHPEISEKFLDSKAGVGFLFELEESESVEEQKADKTSRASFKKVEKKLKKVQSDLAQALEQLGSLRRENEELKKKISQCDSEFEKRLTSLVSQKRKEWFQRYQAIDSQEALKESGRLESLLQRTRRALELQKRADQEYGVLSDISAKLLEIDLSLNRIEAVYAGSLVVHKEVEKVKEALLGEKSRLLKLPGIGKIIRPKEAGAEEIVSRINLLDPVVANLPKIREIQKMAGPLSEIGLIRDPPQVEEAVRHKRRQIFERLYARFEPKEEGKAAKSGANHLDDFVKSGQSRGYELFIDGYNVLLSALGEEEHFLQGDFTRFRNRFIEAVSAGSRYFAKVWLVFDGVEESSSVAANMQIIYTDKTINSADEVLIEKISLRKDKKALLVTADEGIISLVEDKIFALINVADFYLFLFK